MTSLKKDILHQDIKEKQRLFKIEALKRCMVCHDVSNQSKCTKACSKYYHLFEIGSSMVSEKSNICFDECLQNSKDKNCENNCLDVSKSDIKSLINFIAKVKIQDESNGFISQEEIMK